MKPILHTAATLPDDGWYQVAALGQHPVVWESADGKRVRLVQILDAAACQAMVNRFSEELEARAGHELLVDYDHFSEDTDKTSEAAGWIQAIETRADGLHARIHWTDNGETAVRGRRYRFLSPVWNRCDCEDLGNGRVRPLRLDRAAVTNDPNIKGMLPLANRRDQAVEAEPAVSGNHDSPGTPGKESIMDYKQELLAMLGLPADATDEQISAACAARKSEPAEAEAARAERDALQNRATTAEAKVIQFETVALTAQVEADLDRHAGRIVNREQWKTALLQDRPAALALLEGLPEPGQKLLNRRDAKTPAGAEQEGKVANRRADQIAFVNRVSAECGVTFVAAWPIAAQRNPDLFKE